MGSVQRPPPGSVWATAGFGESPPAPDPLLVFFKSRGAHELLPGELCAARPKSGTAGPLGHSWPYLEPFLLGSGMQEAPRLL